MNANLIEQKIDAMFDVVRETVTRPVLRTGDMDKMGKRVAPLAEEIDAAMTGLTATERRPLKKLYQYRIQEIDKLVARELARVQRAGAEIEAELAVLNAIRTSRRGGR